MQEADRAAGVNAPKCFGVAAEDKKRTRPWPPCDPFPYVRNLSLDAIRERLRLFATADAGAERANGRSDVREAGVLIQEHRDAGALELRAQIGLRSVHHDQIRLQRDDTLDIRIDEAADLGTCLRLGRVAVEVADTDDARSSAHREQHLCRGGDDRDDPLRLRLAEAKTRHDDRQHGENND